MTGETRPRCTVESAQGWACIGVRGHHPPCDFSQSGPGHDRWIERDEPARVGALRRLLALWDAGQVPAETIDAGILALAIGITLDGP